MKKIIVLLLIVAACVFSLYLYSQAQKRARSTARPEDMAGKEASSFAELPVKDDARRDAGDFVVTAPVWVEE